MLRAILYDLDGVLIDSEQAWFQVIRRGVRELGAGEVSFEHFRRTFGQGVEADRLEFFPGWTAAELEAFYQRAFVEELDAVELNPAAPRVLEATRARGLSQAVVTNTPLPLARRVLQGKGLDRFFEALACAGEAPEKPAPDLIRLALQRLGLRAEEAIYVGDTETDRRAARAAGVRMAGLGIAADLTLAGLEDLLGQLP
jgi:HAD superfamily hydrolase (TIGR01549 family)